MNFLNRFVNLKTEKTCMKKLLLNDKNGDYLPGLKKLSMTFLQSDEWTEFIECLKIYQITCMKKLLLNDKNGDYLRGQIALCEELVTLLEEKNKLDEQVKKEKRKYKNDEMAV